MNPLPELPRGVMPYAADLTISRQEFERRIMAETEEIGAAFGGDGRLVVRPRRGSLQDVEFFDQEFAALIGSVVVHNRPLHGIPSSLDGAFAADWTLDHIALLTLDIPGFTVPQMKEIAAQVSGMTDRAAKDAKIRELAATMPVVDEDVLAKTV